MKKNTITVESKTPATPQRSLAEIQLAMKQLEQEMEAARQAELEPRRNDITTKFEELNKLVEEMLSLDESYVPPYSIRTERQQLTEENVTTFLGVDGQPIGEINRAFSGGSKKVKAFVDGLLAAKKIVTADVPKANGRGTMTVYKNLPAPTPAPKKNK